MRTGEVAREAGVNIDTLRYYERRGLIEEPERTGAGYREYPSEAVRIIRFIKRAQHLGFTLHEVEELLHLREDQGSTCADVRDAARTKIADIDHKVESLLAMKQALAVLVKSCARKGQTRECPILEALEGRRPTPTKKERRR
jgi:Hg(II)-responsive transcriptional regulator